MEPENIGVTDGLGIGQAVTALKGGQKVARDGWNGKGMYLYLVRRGWRDANDYDAYHTSLKGEFEHDLVPFREYVAMKTAQNDVVPWVCSQSDLLAHDWYIVD